MRETDWNWPSSQISTTLISYSVVISWLPCLTIASLMVVAFWCFQLILASWIVGHLEKLYAKLKYVFIVTAVHSNLDITNQSVRPFLFTKSNVICLVNPQNGSWVLFTLSQNSLYRGSLYKDLNVFCILWFKRVCCKNKICNIWHYWCLTFRAE